MARVVQQRKAPPYAVIVFLFLFLVAAGLAVYLYIELDKTRKDKDVEVVARQKLVSDSELKDPRINELVSKYEEKVRAGKIPETVVGQLSTRVNELTQKINGVVTTYDDAIAQTNALYEEIGESGGLIEMVRQANARSQRTKEEAAKYKGERDDAHDEIDKAKTSYGQLMAQYKGSKERSNVELASLTEKMGDLTKDQTKVLEDAKAAWDRILQERNNMVQSQTDEINARNAKIRQQEGTIAAQRHMIYKMRKAPDVVSKPDGKIVSTTKDGFCFIDVGSSEGAEVGFTFAVYPQTGIPKDGANKGSIIVADVYPLVSRCRVVRQDKTSPVIKDDLVANIAFDSVRRWRFVVEGNFDLQGTGEPTHEGAAEAKLLLKRLGSEVTDKLDVQVDFVIMGAEPALPQKPEDNDPPHVWEAWRGAVKVKKRYGQVRELAKDLRVPIRNANWLLDTTGYAPIKPLRDVSLPWP